MLGVIALILFIAGVAYATYACIVSRRETRAYGQHMHVRFDGHVALYEPRASPAADFGVTPGRDDDRSWHEAPGPSALDLLYAQMAEQEEGYRRRERERERERDLGY